MLRATTATTRGILFKQVPKKVSPVPIGVAQTIYTNNELFSPSRVYCAAVILPKDSPTFKYHVLLQSSEKWPCPQQRAKVSDYIKKESVAWAVFYAQSRRDYSRVMHDCIEQVTRDYDYQTRLRDDDDDDLKPRPHPTPFVVFFANAISERSSLAAANILAHGARDAYISATDLYPAATVRWQADPYGLFVGMAPEMPWPKT